MRHYSNSAFQGHKIAKSVQGQVSYHNGMSAEQAVAADYKRRGYPVGWSRWRGTVGEIDLIAQDQGGFVFIEVKQSRSFDAAVGRLSPRQMQRIYATAEEFLGQTPNGTLSEVRFDVALVNGVGEMQIIENAFGHG